MSNDSMHKAMNDFLMGRKETNAQSIDDMFRDFMKENDALFATLDSSTLELCKRAFEFHVTSLSLQDASSSRTFETSLDSYSKKGGHCHGCGEQHLDLKLCDHCKRVSYCSRECQMVDWKKPYFHKKSCRAHLLDIAMNNIYRLALEEKFALMMQGKSPPNGNVNQTMAKVSCPNASALLDCAEQELGTLEEICTMPSNIAAGMGGNCQDQHTDHPGYGLDVGVETLCLALSLWPGVYTVTSCSSLHAMAFVPDGRGGFVNPTAVIAYVGDSVDTLASISEIVGRGALGIRFKDAPAREHHDSVRGMEGFCTIDCLVDGKPKKCRAYGREIWWAHHPFDKLDEALWKKENPPYGRSQNNLVGCVGLALNLTKGNPSLEITVDEYERISSLLAAASDLRSRLIRSGNERLGLAT